MNRCRAGNWENPSSKDGWRPITEWTIDGFRTHPWTERASGTCKRSERFTRRERRLEFYKQVTRRGLPGGDGRGDRAANAAEQDGFGRPVGN